ncbi:MAG: hypothetical protein KDC65_13135 [Saprospiraceae bacterium]|nr:hypothetical protein [Saprospiraceae bacterium]
MINTLNLIFREFSRKTVALLVIALALPVMLRSQISGIPLRAPAYHILDRLDISSGIPGPIHPELKYYPRQYAVDYALALDSQATRLGWRDQADLQYLFDDNTDCLPDSSHYCMRNKKGLFNIFYKTPANFFEVNAGDFRLRVNPMFNFHIAQQRGDPQLLFQNQRGLEVRGSVDGKVHFYTNLIETQARYADYIDRRIDAFEAVPGAGSFKNYRPRVLDIDNAYDFNIANAYISIQATRHIGIQFGHGRHFIGNGYRSLFLSDYAANGFYLKVNTRVWRLHYQNLFLELSPVSSRQVGGNELIPKKYAAIHYLNYRITPRIAVGLFEATVFNRSRQFELQYLNPVILYRTVEGMIGSPDNVIVGLDGRWNFLNRFQFYSQLLIDEFLFSAVVKPEKKGWWGNKIGFQTGLKYVNAFGVDHLDLQLEYNSVRPYTYSHYDSLNSYTQYNQALAHPLLSNFREIVGLVRYQPASKLTLSGRWMHAYTGEDRDSENWGSNPLLGYGSRVQDYGNVIGQGVSANIDLLGIEATWMLYHNLFVDLSVLLRNKNSDDDTRDLNTKVFGIGLRMNIWNPPLDF